MKQPVYQQVITSTSTITRDPLPEGYVYLGAPGEFVKPAIIDLFEGASLGAVHRWGKGDYNGLYPGALYAVPIDSEIHKHQPWYQPQRPFRKGDRVKVARAFADWGCTGRLLGEEFVFSDDPQARDSGLGDGYTVVLRDDGYWFPVGSLELVAAVEDLPTEKPAHIFTMADKDRVQYRNGEKAVMLCDDLETPYSIATKNKAGKLKMHMSCGAWLQKTTPYDYDLVLIPEPPREPARMWANEYPQGFGGPHKTAQSARDEAGRHAIRTAVEFVEVIKPESACQE